MSKKLEQTQNILKYWNTLSSLPLGSRFFATALRWVIPYTGTIAPRIVKLETGHVIVEMKDRRSVRNHLNSVHAIALANIGEFSTGLVLTTKLGPRHRIILTELKISYLKKARGTLRAESRFDGVTDDFEGPCELQSEITDHSGQIVCTVVSTWKLGLKKVELK